MPSIRLLDSYYATLYPLSSLSTSVGVFEELAPIRASYPVVLDFGLRVSLPAKFAGARLRWQDVKNGPDLSSPSPAGTLQADAYVIDGNEDRVEDTRKKRGTYDVAPAGNDPFLGGAAALSYQPLDTLEVSVLGGLVDARPDPTEAPSGKRSTAFGQLVSVAHLAKASGFPTTLSLDLRTSSDKWRNTAAGHPTPAARDQRSGSLTVSTRVSPAAWLLVGAHAGKSERAIVTTAQDRISSVDGFDFETGVLASLGSDLNLQLMLSTEKRTIQGAGQDGGAFIDVDGSRHKTMRRYGLVLAYALNEKA
jgi:hypothetical protein